MSVASSAGWSEIGYDGAPIANDRNNSYLKEDYQLLFRVWAQWIGDFEVRSANNVKIHEPNKPENKKYDIPAQVFEDDTLTRTTPRGPIYVSPRFEEYCKHLCAYMESMYQHAKTINSAAPPAFVELRIFRKRGIYLDFDLPKQLVCTLAPNTAGGYVCKFGAKATGSDISIVKIVVLSNGSLAAGSSAGVELASYGLDTHVLVSNILTTPYKKRGGKHSGSIDVPVSKCFYNCEVVWGASAGSKQQQRVIVTGHLEVHQKEDIKSRLVGDMAGDGMRPPA
jgi:hypothetical protein